MQKLIFQLGTNNWQRQGEFAPGSGILHEAHHNAYNAMEGVTCYSVYPSKVQTSNDPLVRIFPLTHDIPICESVSPVSNYRFHGMSESEFTAYVARLQDFAGESIDIAERREGRNIDLAVAHHSFLNPLVLSRINRERAAMGKPRIKLLCFVHGTALKMYAHEKASIDPEYPPRFYPFMQSERVFNGDENIDTCAAISTEQLGKFADIFPDYPKEKILLSLNGYNTAVFKPNADAYAKRHTIIRNLALAESPVKPLFSIAAAKIEKVVIFCGKFADWKRLECLLLAASEYEKRGGIATLIVGSGPDEAVMHYHSLAYEKLQLRNTWFLGPRQHTEIAQLNAAADVGVYPSRNEPFGLVLIECMACGTPVIGANSGGPRDFVSGAVGTLVDESDDATFSTSLANAVMRALDDNWKQAKGSGAALFARQNFSVESQCRKLLAGADGLAA